MTRRRIAFATLSTLLITAAFTGESLVKPVARPSILFSAADESVELRILRDFALPNKKEWPANVYPTRGMSGTNDLAFKISLKVPPGCRDTVFIATLDSTLLPSFSSQAFHSLEPRKESPQGWSGFGSFMWCSDAQWVSLTVSDSATFYIPYSFHRRHTYFRSSKHQLMNFLGFNDKVTEDFTADSILFRLDYRSTGIKPFAELPFFITVDPATGRHAFASCSETQYRRIITRRH